MSFTLPMPERPLRIQRILPAPRERVFRAWTDPDEIACWLATQSCTGLRAEVDLRVGGRFRMQGVDHSGHRVVVCGTYVEVKPPERLAYTWSTGEERGDEALVTVEFHDRGGSTEVVLVQDRRREHTEDGWTGLFKNLIGLLEERRAARAAPPSIRPRWQRILSRRAPSPSSDPRLQALQWASTEGERERGLERLLVECVEPVVRRVVRSRLRAGVTSAGEDAEDVRSRALMLVVARIRRAMSGGPPIANLERYAAVVAYHARDDHLREKYPYRWRLKNQLRYVISHDSRFAMWETAEGWWAGLSEWQQPHLAPRQGRLPVACPAAKSPAEFLAWLFAQSDGPLDFEAIVTLATESWPVRDRLPTDPDRLPDHRGPDVSVAVAERLALERLWAEILALPVRQRMALLLNLRDGMGGDVIAFLPATGVASVRQIAEAIEIPEADLAEIWNRLPLSDQEIAVRLGCTRQQVINLRKTARVRLARRTMRERRPRAHER
jgi:uncharacterized protein YndB with AHSA1/START domain